MQWAESAAQEMLCQQNVKSQIFFLIRNGNGKELKNLAQESGVQNQNQPKSADRTFEWVEQQQQASNLGGEQPAIWGGAPSATWMQPATKSSSTSASASPYASTSGTWLGTTNSSSTSLSPKNSCDKSSTSSFSLFTGFWAGGQLSVLGDLNFAARALYLFPIQIYLTENIQIFLASLCTILTLLRGRTGKISFTNTTK